MNKQKINIRYNTNYPEKSKYPWRVIADGKEHLVNDVRIEPPSYTTAEFIEGLGMKYHITTDGVLTISESAGKKLALISSFI